MCYCSAYTRWVECVKDFDDYESDLFGDVDISGMCGRNGRGLDDCVGNWDYSGLAVGVDWGGGSDGRVRADGDSGLVGIAGGDYWLPRRIDDPQIACHVLSACDKSSTTSDM